MQPDQQNNVWISREEYDRLKAASQAPQVSPVIMDQTNYLAYQQMQFTKAERKERIIQRVLALLLSIALLLSLIIPNFHILLIPVVIFFLLFGILSIRDFLEAKSNIPEEHGLPRPPRETYRVLLIILGCLAVAPFIFFGGLIALFIILAGSGGSQGS